MKKPSRGSFWIAAILATFVLVLGAAAQVEPAAAPAAAAPAAAKSNGNDSGKPATAGDRTASGNEPAKVSLSPAVVEILKLLEAGISTEIVKAYVESSATAFSPSAADLIALKQHGVTDDLTKALLKQGAENRAQAAQAATAGTATPPAAGGEAGPAAAPAYTIRVVNSGRLDPESYEYFQHYYLFPRTLANVYQTLGYNPNTYGPVGFAPAYGPYFPPGYGRVRRFGPPVRPFQTFPQR
jgi:hypothetical protein